MTANWTLILNWIIQGLILGSFALAGVYLALRLFAGQRSSPPPPAGAPLAAAPPSSSSVRPAAAATAKAADPSHSRPAYRPPADPDAVRRAFEFGDDNRLTMILEMPVSYLADDGALVELWVDAVGWARLEQSHPAGAANDGRVQPAASAASGASPEHLQVHLDQVLKRLQLSADRRGQLRSLLDQKMPAGELEL